MPEDRFSTSFADSEVKILDFVFATLQRGGDARAVVHNKAFSGLRVKIARMQNKAQEKKKSLITTERLEAAPGGDHGTPQTEASQEPACGMQTL